MIIYYEWDKDCQFVTLSINEKSKRGGGQQHKFVDIAHFKMFNIQTLNWYPCVQEFYNFIFEMGCFFNDKFSNKNNH